jgi:hypothetical protein
MAVVIDTHILIWYIAEPQELSAAALTAMESATAANEPIYPPFRSSNSAILPNVTEFLRSS